MPVWLFDRCAFKCVKILLFNSLESSLSWRQVYYLSSNYPVYTYILPYHLMQGWIYKVRAQCVVFCVFCSSVSRSLKCTKLYIGHREYYLTNNRSMKLPFCMFFNTIVDKKSTGGTGGLSARSWRPTSILPGLRYIGPSGLTSQPAHAVRAQGSKRSVRGLRSIFSL